MLDDSYKNAVHRRNGTKKSRQEEKDTTQCVVLSWRKCRQKLFGKLFFFPSMDDVLFVGAFFFKKKKDPCLFGAKIADTETEKQKKNETSRTALHPSLKTVFFVCFTNNRLNHFRISRTVFHAPVLRGTHELFRQLMGRETIYGGGKKEKKRNPAEFIVGWLDALIDGPLGLVNEFKRPRQPKTVAESTGPTQNSKKKRRSSRSKTKKKALSVDGSKRRNRDTWTGGNGTFLLKKKKETRFFLWKFWVNPKKHVARTRSDYFSELIDFGIHSELGWYGSWTAAE